MLPKSNTPFKLLKPTDFYNRDKKSFLGKDINFYLATFDTIIKSYKFIFTAFAFKACKLCRENPYGVFLGKSFEFMGNLFILFRDNRYFYLGIERLEKKEIFACKNYRRNCLSHLAFIFYFN